MWCLLVYPTFSKSLCFPPALIQVWDDVALGGVGVGTSPVNMDLNCTIPALTNKSVGSSGTKGALGYILCPLLSKNFKNSSLISIIFFLIIYLKVDFIKKNINYIFIGAHMAL